MSKFNIYPEILSPLYSIQNPMGRKQGLVTVVKTIDWSGGGLCSAPSIPEKGVSWSIDTNNPTGRDTILFE